VEFFQTGEMGQIQHAKDNALIENKTIYMKEKLMVKTLNMCTRPVQKVSDVIFFRRN
jgi:hypothetical protein